VPNHARKDFIGAGAYSGRVESAGGGFYCISTARMRRLIADCIHFSFAARDPAERREKK
jgi:hypothetical protein